MANSTEIKLTEREANFAELLLSSFTGLEILLNGAPADKVHKKYKEDFIEVMGATYKATLSEYLRVEFILRGAIEDGNYEVEYKQKDNPDHIAKLIFK
jgi:hypothetical protein